MIASEIASPSGLRAFLVETMHRVRDGRISAGEGSAIAALGEVALRTFEPRVPPAPPVAKGWWPKPVVPDVSLGDAEAPDALHLQDDPAKREAMMAPPPAEPAAPKAPAVNVVIRPDRTPMVTVLAEAIAAAALADASAPDPVPTSGLPPVPADAEQSIDELLSSLPDPVPAAPAAPKRAPAIDWGKAGKLAVGKAAPATVNGEPIRPIRRGKAPPPPITKPLANLEPKHAEPPRRHEQPAVPVRPAPVAKPGKVVTRVLPAAPRPAPPSPATMAPSGGKVFCDQCDRAVSSSEVAKCASKFCTIKRLSAPR